MIDVLLLVGVFAAILLADKVGRVRLHVAGNYQWWCNSGVDLFIGFMLFNFMTNMGPNAQTYLLAGEVFPTRMRAQCAGFAAAFAKVDAVTTAYLFPVLLADIGTTKLLYMHIAAGCACHLVISHRDDRS